MSSQRDAITQAFDYIVVGAGSAGCVLAARLAQSGVAKVALIEAGGRAVNPLYRVPLAAHALAVRTALDATESRALLDGAINFPEYC